MSEHTQQLADRCIESRDTLLAALAVVSDEQWHQKPEGDDRTLGAIMHHIAGSYVAIRDTIAAVLMDAPLPHMFQGDDDVALTRWNAEYAEQYKDCGKAETLALLDQNSTMAAEYIRSLKDEQLKKTGDYPLLVLWFNGPPTVEQIIDGMFINHPNRHLPDIWAVCGQ